MWKTPLRLRRARNKPISDELRENRLAELTEAIESGDYDHDKFDAHEVEEAITVELNNNRITLGRAMHLMEKLARANMSGKRLKDEEIEEAIAATDVANNAVAWLLEERVDDIITAEREAAHQDACEQVAGGLS